MTGDDSPRLRPHPVFAISEPQMSNDERAALEGVLSQLKPRLAIEIGTAEGATRSGVDAVDYAAYTKVAAVGLDWIPGYIFSNPHFQYELWGGLGCVLIDRHDAHSTLGCRPCRLATWRSSRCSNARGVRSTSTRIAPPRRRSA